MEMPQHPARQEQQAPQQGLEAPQAAPEQNPYFRPSAAMQGYNGQLQAAQAQQAQAGAQKAQAEAAMLQQAQAQQGLGNPVQAGATVSPQEVQAEQLADGIIKGQVGQEQLGAMIQAGELDPAVAEAAMSMAQQFMQADQQRLEQADAQGLGQLQ